MVKLKRVYEEYEKDDGFRVLVDRLWPRGVAKEKAHINLWLKEIAPSTQLRKWFGHNTKKWEEFEKRYKDELKQNKALLTELKNLEKEHKQLTLIYSAKDIHYNNAVVLKQML